MSHIKDMEKSTKVNGFIYKCNKNIYDPIFLSILMIYPVHSSTNAAGIKMERYAKSLWLSPKRKNVRQGKSRETRGLNLGVHGAGLGPLEL